MTPSCGLLKNRALREAVSRSHPPQKVTTSSVPVRLALLRGNSGGGQGATSAGAPIVKAPPRKKDGDAGGADGGNSGGIGKHNTFSERALEQAAPWNMQDMAGLWDMTRTLRLECMGLSPR